MLVSIYIDCVLVCDQVYVNVATSTRVRTDERRLYPRSHRSVSAVQFVKLAVD